jgi:hypothetical protein
MVGPRVHLRGVAGWALLLWWLRHGAPSIDVRPGRNPHAGGDQTYEGPPAPAELRATINGCATGHVPPPRDTPSTDRQRPFDASLTPPRGTTPRVGPAHFRRALGHRFLKAVGSDPDESPHPRPSSPLRCPSCPWSAARGKGGGAVPQARRVRRAQRGVRRHLRSPGGADRRLPDRSRAQRTRSNSPARPSTTRCWHTGAQSSRRAEPENASLNSCRCPYPFT